MNYVFLVGLVCSCTLAAQPAPGTGSIEGRVLNSRTSAPVRKATVNLTAQNIWLGAETDSEGRFQFASLPPGSYGLSTKRSGFQDQPARRPVVVGQDEHVADVVIRLRPLSTLTGHVLDEDGDPVDGASVSIFREIYLDGRKQWDRINASAHTSDSGEYRHAGLSPGRYIVEALHSRPMVDNQYGARDQLEKPVMIYVPAFYPNAPGEQAATPVEVGLGEDVRGIDIHLARAPLFHVRGRVSGASPDSRAVISIGLGPADGAASLGEGGGTVVVPPNYSFDVRVTPGQYNISATQSSGDGPVAYATDRIAVLGNVSGLVLTMGPPMELAGRISLAERGNWPNLQGLTVVLHWFGSWGDLPRPVEIDATGKLAFPKPTPPGRYALTVYVRSIPIGFYVKSVNLGGQEIPADGVEILSSAQVEIVLSNKAGAITGSALDNDGKPIPDSRVTLIPSDPNSEPAAESTDDTGNFRFTALRPGKYKLFAWEEVDDGLWRNPEFRKKYEDRGTEITIGPSETQNVQLHAIAVEEMN
jgi:protocatechuate 3,4-dioxygenase beta subunit